MSRWLWLRKEALTAIHAEQLAEHGGSAGVRDAGLLESALARPENLAAYGEPDVFELAAAYAFGVVKDHPFVDGNKRAGFMAAATYLALNGQSLEATDAEAVTAVLALASSAMEEEAFAAWLRENSRPFE
jgi:death-on-curing protein